MRVLLQTALTLGLVALCASAVQAEPLDGSAEASYFSVMSRSRGEGIVRQEPIDPAPGDGPSPCDSSYYGDYWEGRSTNDLGTPIKLDTSDPCYRALRPADKRQLKRDRAREERARKWSQPTTT